MLTREGVPVECESGELEGAPLSRQGSCKALASLYGRMQDVRNPMVLTCTLADCAKPHQQMNLKQPALLHREERTCELIC